MKPAPPIAPNEIVSQRLVAAPPDRVFAAFADPKQLTLWFGPDGFTSTFETFDFRVGGEWTFVFHGPNGTDYPNRSVFTGMVEPEFIAYDHVCPPHFHMTMTMDPDDGGTLLTWRMTFVDAKVFEACKSICIPGNEQNFNRLEAHLATH